MTRKFWLAIAAVLAICGLLALPLMLSPRTAMQLLLLAGPVGLAAAGYPTLATGAVPLPAVGRFFIKTLPAIAVGAGAKVIQIMNVQDGDFTVSFFTAASTGKFRCSISVAGVQITDDAVHSDLLFGTAQNPALVLGGHVFPKGSQIKFEITDISGAPNVVDIALHGQLAA